VSQNLAPVRSGHALAEAMGALAALVMGLIGHFHGRNSLKNGDMCR